ncbi:MAG TPA: deoxycytidine triphosphate deaminase [Verrucomicrobiae bacterium]|nr:deoxycytidine triphosphate deaminase [Verrucomicrobiae bacterium]
MGVYSNQQIRQAVADKHIVCHPYNEGHIGPTSIDVTLGFYYYRLESTNGYTVYNPFDRDDIERYFDGPYKAAPYEQWCTLNGLKPTIDISPEHPVIALGPGERILAHTHEFLGITPPGAYELHSRSSWRHNGIAVCFDADWINPGYINRLTLEICNMNNRELVILPVGERIAQVVFHETGEVKGDHSSQDADNLDLEALIRTWSPSLILPQVHKGQRTLPVKIEGMSYD